jgi:hypothetical protein
LNLVAIIAAVLGVTLKHAVAVIGGSEAYLGISEIGIQGQEIHDVQAETEVAGTLNAFSIAPTWSAILTMSRTWSASTTVITARRPS